MPFEIKSNADQYSSNLLMLPKNGSGDPLYTSKKILARYRTSFLNTDLATLTKIYIDGVAHNFVATQATDTAAGRAGIVSEIQTIMDTLLGTNDGHVVVSISGTRVYITTDYSELKIEKVGVSSTYSVFIPTDAYIAGTADADVACPVIHISLNSTADFYKVRIKPVCGRLISALNIDWNGGTDEFDSSWPKASSYALPTGTTIVNGFVCFDVAVATGNTGGTMIISITPLAGTAIVFSQTIKFLDYNGQ